jgi:hypothetical protein
MPILTTGVGTRAVASGGGGGAIVWRGINNVELVGSGVVQTATVVTGTPGPTRRVIMMVEGFANPTQSIVSVVVNGVPLTLRVTDGGNPDVIGAIYDGIVNVADTSNNVVVTWGIATQQTVAFTLWTSSTLTTGYISGGPGVIFGANLTLTAGDNLLYMSTLGTAGDYSTSTEVPTTVHLDTTGWKVQSAEWQPIISSYASNSFLLRHNGGGQFKGMWGVYN